MMITMLPNSSPSKQPGKMWVFMYVSLNYEIKFACTLERCWSFAKMTQSTDCLPMVVACLPFLRSLQSRRVEYFTQASAFQKRALGKVMAHISGRLLPAIQYARCKLYFNLHHCFPLPIHSPTLHPCPSAPEKKQLKH